MENACFQMPYFKRFNPDKSLIIDSVCTEQCQVAMSVSYQFGVYMNMGTLTAQNWVLYEDNQGLLEGKRKLQVQFDFFGTSAFSS